MLSGVLGPRPLRRSVRLRLGFPTLLLLSADSDDRVEPMHARKLAAAVQNSSTGGPVYLRIETNAGHGGADLIRATIEKEADKWPFILDQMGLH